MTPAVVVVISVVFIAIVAIRRAMAPAARVRPPRTLSLIHHERRRSSRIVPPRDQPAELQIMGSDFLEIPEVRDISETGLAISVPHKFNGNKPTNDVDLLLTLHGQGTVRARGAIRRVSHTRDTATFGVELVSIDEADRTKIRQYVTKVKEGEPKDALESPRTTALPDPIPGSSR